MNTFKPLKNYLVRWWMRRHCAHVYQYGGKSKWKGCPYVLGCWTGGACPPCNHYKPRRGKEKS